MPTSDVAIVGGGISGLSALHFLRTRRPELNVQLLEADTRLGGTIGTELIDGQSFDSGPNGFLDREPLTLQLCSELGLEDTLERANANVRKRFILRGGRLREVPMSPLKFMGSDILSLRGRLRILKEPFVRARATDDESIYDFASRRIGREAADYLVQPMVSGVYGGLADRLSLQSCFPIMHEMESRYGSLVKAMIAKKRAAKKNKQKTGGPAGPAGWLTSFYGGLYRLIERFENRYSEFIQTDQPIDSIARQGDTCILHSVRGQSINAREAIIATPAYRAADIVTELSSTLAEQLSAIPYAPIAVVCLGFAQTDVVHPLDGFGFLVPHKERKSILGSIWTSSIFAERAPQGSVQFRTMLGGDGNHSVKDRSDDELIAQTCNDLNEIVGLRSAPQIAKVYQWHRGIPQFVIGHRKKLHGIEQELQRLGHLHLVGNAYYGISLNDCVKQAHRVVESLPETRR